MFKLNVTFLICLTIWLNVLVDAKIQTLKDHQQLTSSIEAIEIVENLDDFLQKHPDIKLIELTKESLNISSKILMRNGEQRQPIRYTLGYPHPSDARLVEGSNTYYYPTLQDVQLQLSYPESGIGGVVNFVEILIDQNSDVGRAYIVAGGLGERFIRLLVEAKLVSYFSYKATFYGYH